MLKLCPRACNNDDDGKCPVANAKQEAMGITTSCSNESRRLEEAAAMVDVSRLCPRGGSSLEELGNWVVLPAARPLPPACVL